MFLNLKKLEYFNYKNIMYKKIKGFYYMFNYNRLKFDLIRSKYCLVFFLGFYKNLLAFKNIISFSGLNSKKFKNFLYYKNSNLKIGAFSNKFSNIKFLVKELSFIWLVGCISVAKIKFNLVNSTFLFDLFLEIEKFVLVEFIFKFFFMVFKYFWSLSINIIFKYAYFKSIII